MAKYQMVSLKDGKIHNAGKPCSQEEVDAMCKGGPVPNVPAKTGPYKNFKFVPIKDAKKPVGVKESDSK